MAKTLRTSGDYTIKAGSGSAGTNQILLDALTVRVTGDLMIDGNQTVINTETLSVEDAILVLNRNESSNADTGSDSGIIINRGEAGVNAAFYWDESLNVFKVATTASAGTGGVGTTITDLALAKLRVATPVDNNDAATKAYVDGVVVGAAGITDFQIVGDDSTGATIGDGDDIRIIGGSNMGVVVTADPDTVTINLDQNLSDINSISNGSTNGDLALAANGTGSIVINNILTFSSNSTTPAAGSITKIYSKAVAGGGTGVFFINSAVASGTEDELISKKKATALAIALG